VIQYDRLIIRIEPSAGPHAYQVSVEGEEGEGRGQFDLPFEGLDIENFVLRMSRARGTRRVETSEAHRAKHFGRELFAALFQGEVRDVYRSCLAEARRNNRGLRVTLALTTVPELMDVPWEYLYDEPDFLAVSAWTPVVRYLEIARPRTPLAISPPLRVLGMVSDVVDLPRLDVEGERQRLEAALRGLRAQGRVEVHWTHAATLDALLRKLHHGDFHILHFVGHGGYDEASEDGVLLLEGPDGRSDEITGGRLATILQDHRSLRLVVLNACEGARTSRSDPFAGVAASLVHRGIPAVVAMQFEITDYAALTFATYFYEALAQGDPVDGAVAHARLGIFASGNDVEWGTPVLFLRSADAHIFELQGEQARSPEAELSLAFEAHPTVATVGDPITWLLHIQNVGTPSLFRATPRDDTGWSLGDPVDLVSGEDAVFTWSSTAEHGLSATVSVTATEANGREVHAHAQARLDVESPTPAVPAAPAAHASAPPAAVEPAVAEPAAAQTASAEQAPPAPPPDGVLEPRKRRGPNRRVPAIAAAAVLVAVVAVALALALGGEGGGGEGGGGDESAGKVLGAVSIGAPTVDAFATDKAVWFAARDDGTLRRIDAGSGKPAGDPVRFPSPYRLAGPGGSRRGGRWAAASLWMISGSVSQAGGIDDRAAAPRPRTVDLPNSPYDVAVGEGYVWVLAQAAGPRQGGQLIAIDPVSARTRDQRSGTATLDGLAAAHGAVWVLAESGAVLRKVSPNTLNTLREIPVGAGSSAVVADSAAVWVANGDTGRLLRVNPRSNDIVARIAVRATDNVALAAGGGAIWWIDRDRGAATRVDAGDNKVVGSPLQLGGPLGGAAVSGHTLWVARPSEPSVARIDF
jgi:hypothetical protein